MSRFYPPEFYDELKRRSDIVTVASSYFPIQKRGKQYWACCPFHHETKPSFTINQESGYFHCFGCSESGTVIDLVSKLENCNRDKAIEILADKAGLKLPEGYGNAEEIERKKKEKNEILKALNLAKNHYIENLYKPFATPAQQYLKTRKFKKSDLENFAIGYAHGNDVIKFLRENNISDEIMKKASILSEINGRQYDFQSGRLIFPILNSFLECVGFSGRILVDADGRAKYKNSSQTMVFDKSSCLYGIHLIKQIKKEKNIDKIILVEGQIDVIKMNSFGFRPTVASLGTALTEKHALEIKRFCDNVVLLYDGDSAGVKATERAIWILKNAGLNIDVARLPNGMDPDEVLKTYGKEKMQEILDNSQNYVEYLLTRAQEKNDITKPEGKSACIKESLKIIEKLDTSSEKEIYLKLLSKNLGIAVETLKSDVAVIDNDKNFENDKKVVLTTKEDGNIKAIKYVILSFIKNLEFTKELTAITKYIENPIYKKLLEKIINGNKDFDEDEQSALDNILELDDDVNQKFIDECAHKIFTSYMQNLQQVLNERYNLEQDLQKRVEISKEIQEVIRKLKSGKIN